MSWPLLLAHNLRFSPIASVARVLIILAVFIFIDLVVHVEGVVA